MEEAPEGVVGGEAEGFGHLRLGLVGMGGDVGFGLREAILGDDLLQGHACLEFDGMEQLELVNVE